MKNDTENGPTATKALYERPTLTAAGSFRNETGWLVVVVRDPYGRGYF